MVFRGEKTGNWFYVGIAFFIVVLIILTVLFSTNTLFQAYVEDRFLVDGWLESGDREGYSERLFGLEKQSSFKYIVSSSSDENGTAFLTVTSIKTVFMINEEELLDKTIETIFNAADSKNITIDTSSKFTASRFLKNGHSTFFVVFNGTQTIDGFVENIKIIGETWNCDRSGTSVICIGVAQTTDVKNGNPLENFVYWAKITGDEKGTFKEIYNDADFVNLDGLIFNVKCH